MKVTLAVAALLAVWLLWLSVDHVPAGSAGILEAGGGARTLEPGFHLRVPFSARPRVYRLALPAVAGDVDLPLPSGLTCKVPFEISGRIDTAQVLAFHRSASSAGAETLLRQAAERALREAGAVRPALDIASGTIEQAASERAGALLAAAGLAEVSLRLRPLSPEALLRVAQTLAPHRLAGRVKAAAEAALASNPGLWETHTTMGLALESEKDFRGAEKLFLDALTIHPTAEPPMAELVAIYSAVGDFARLDRLLRAALEADPNGVQHLNWLGMSLLKQGRNDEAEKVLVRALSLDQANVRLLNNLGGVHLKQGRFEDALADFRKAAEAEPRDRQTLYNLGIALAARGDTKEGLESLLAAERAGGAGEPLLRAIADAYKALGDAKKASEYARRAAAAAPDAEPAAQRR